MYTEVGLHHAGVVIHKTVNLELKPL